MLAAAELLKEGTQHLRAHDCADADPSADASFLLAHALGSTRERLFAHPETAVSAARARRFRSLVVRRLKHEPLAYLLGSAWFRGREFEVRRGITLIPRWATETLAITAIRDLARLAPLTVVDVGTGSGCLAVSLAAELPDAKIIATDISPTALAIARRNAKRHGVSGRIEFRRGDLAAPALGRTPAAGPLAVVANLPYLPAGDFKNLQPEIRLHEPKGALVAGKDGLDLYRRLLAQLAAAARRPLYFHWEVLAEQVEPLQREIMSVFPSAACQPVVNDVGTAVGVAVRA